MREIPEYSKWESAKPPATGWWLATGASLMLLVSLVGVLVQGENSGSLVFTVMLLVVVITGFLWLFRLLYYRFSAHHKINWQRKVGHEKRQWWQDHQSLLALREVVLLGPSGGGSDGWSRVLSRAQRPPVERLEPGGKAFRIAQTFSVNILEREEQLTRALVMQWQKFPRDASPVISHCFWLGSDAAWSAFCAQMKVSFPEVSLPGVPQIWQGEATLSRLAALLREDETSQHLVAGCVSCPAVSDSLLPAGESAALWLVGSEGPVVLPRGEFYDASSSDSLKKVCERAVSQCELDDAPDDCILFSHPQVPEMDGSGWNTSSRLQDSYWGASGTMEPLIAISLAAIFAQNEAQPCCWVATDPQHTLALGIVKPHGKG